MNNIYREREKPPIKAKKWDGDFLEMAKFCSPLEIQRLEDTGTLLIQTAEGGKLVRRDSWVIKRTPRKIEVMANWEFRDHFVEEK